MKFLLKLSQLSLIATLIPLSPALAEVLHKDAAQYSSLISPMIKQITTSSPTGARVHTTTANNGEVVYEFELDSASRYEVEALLLADATYRNSFGIVVNSEPVIEWEVEPAATYTWRKVGQEFLGEQGIQQVRFLGREAYVRIAAVRINKIAEDPIIPVAPAPSRFDGIQSSTVLNAVSLADAASKALIAQPNTKIILPSGTINGATVTLRGTGAEGAPIVIEGQPDGSTILTGQITMTIKGSHVLVRNLNIQNYDSTNYGGGMITFDTCSYCGIHNSRFDTSVAAIMNVDNADTKHFKAIRIKPSSQSVEIARNTFKSKRNAGSCVLVDRDVNRTNLHEGHRIFSNLFLDRELENNDANDFDVIRIGASSQSRTPDPVAAETLMTGTNATLVGTTVEFNVFEGVIMKPSVYASCSTSGNWNSTACRGEPEIISIKAPQTIVRFNTFRNNSGGLTIRHGFQSIVEGNYFTGMNTPQGISTIMPNSYGIRVTGENNLVMNNHMENLSAASDLLGGLSLLPGNTTTDLAGYWQIFDNIISGNFIKNVSSKPVVFAADYGGKNKTIVPERVVFSENAVSQCTTATFNHAPNGTYLGTFGSYDNLYDCLNWGTVLSGQAQIPLATTVENRGLNIPTDGSLVGITGVLYNNETKHTARLDYLSTLSGSAASERMNKLSQFLMIERGSLYDNYQPLRREDVGSSF